MASGIFAILDDVAMLLDDTAAMSKIAAKKTAGLLGDDLAVNAEKATGFKACRELPVIWAITRGSMINKVIILPVAFLLSAFLPWLMVPILLLGGAYLSLEGAEKAFEWIFPHEQIKPAAEQITDPGELLHQENNKISAAIRTDFILSIEIIVISLETVIEQPLVIQITVVSLIALLATVGVYGLVALLVRMDDAGIYLINQAISKRGLMTRVTRNTGKLLIVTLPRAIRLLSVIGTIAMLLVGGGMLVHNIDTVHHLLEPVPALAADMLAGMVVGLSLLAASRLLQKLSKAGR